MGYLRSTPTSAIEVETVCPPFNIRCRWLAGKFLLKSLLNSNSFIFDTFFSLFLNWRYVQKSLPVFSLTDNSLSSFPEYIFSSNLLPCFDISYDSLLYLPSVNKDPCFLDLSPDRLKFLPPSTVNNFFLDYISINFPLFILVYTDGYVSSHSAGCSFTIPKLYISYSNNLPPPLHPFLPNVLPLLKLSHLSHPYPLTVF
jgi:hypothetical protein